MATGEVKVRPPRGEWKFRGRITGTQAHPTFPTPFLSWFFPLVLILWVFSCHIQSNFIFSSILCSLFLGFHVCLFEVCFPTNEKMFSNIPSIEKLPTVIMKHFHGAIIWSCLTIIQTPLYQGFYSANTRDRSATADQYCSNDSDINNNRMIIVSCNFILFACARYHAKGFTSIKFSHIWKIVTIIVSYL